MSPIESMPSAARIGLELPPLSQAGTMRVTSAPRRTSSMVMARQPVPPPKIATRLRRAVR
jgi:hypothetical protein